MSRFGVTAAVAAAGVLAGCGVPADSTPRPLPKSLPFDPVTVACPPVALQPTRVDVWFFVRKAQPASPAASPEAASSEVRELVPASREVPPQVCHVLLELLKGPFIDEATETNYETQILGTGLLAEPPTADGAIAKVVLRESFADNPEHEGALALGQMVFTATGVEGIESVEFRLSSGRPLGLSLPGGSDRPLRREDFRDVFPA